MVSITQTGNGKGNDDGDSGGRDYSRYLLPLHLSMINFLKRNLVQVFEAFSNLLFSRMNNLR